MSYMQLLIDLGLADYSWLLGRAIDNGFRTSVGPDDWLARTLPGLESRGGHNAVLNWLFAYPP